MRARSQKIKPTYQLENGLWFLYFNDLPFPKDFQPKVNSVVNIPPNQFGGNHKHPRIEVFVAIGEGLELVWLDKKGKKHKQKMNPKGELRLFVIPPYLPHAVINRSTTKSGIILEFSDTKQHGLEPMKII